MWLLLKLLKRFPEKPRGGFLTSASRQSRWWAARDNSSFGCPSNRGIGCLSRFLRPSQYRGLLCNLHCGAKCLLGRSDFAPGFPALGAIRCLATIVRISPVAILATITARRSRSAGRFLAFGAARHGIA